MVLAEWFRVAVIVESAVTAEVPPILMSLALRTCPFFPKASTLWQVRTVPPLPIPAVNLALAAYFTVLPVKSIAL